MSHEVETMFSGSNERPWHGLGKILPGQLTAADALIAAGLDWKVALHPVHAEIPGIGSVATEHQAVVRDTDQKVLGVVGPSYRPLQNESAFTVLDDLVTAGEAIWETAGSLWGGKAVWAMAKLPKEIVVRRPGGITDEVKEYFLITNRHDGWGAVQIKLTPIRVVCRNTLTAALNGSSIKLTHVGDMEARIKAAADALGLANKMHEELGEIYQAMADRAFNQDETTAYFKRCLKLNASDSTPGGDANEVDAATKDESLPRRLNKLLELSETGAGADMARGTLWGAYNAVTELADHGAAYRTPEAREAAILTGGYHGIKAKAFKLAVATLDR